jgi:uncharacterized protein (DUF4415 family)
MLESHTIQGRKGYVSAYGVKPGGKEPVTMRLDADLLARLRALGRGWQTRLNAALRRLTGLARR